MRTLFVGDVHGCYDELIALMKHCQLTPDDHLYFTGDLVNKGPKSVEVVDWIRSRPNTWSVIGNHEYFLMSDESKLLSWAHDPQISPSDSGVIEWNLREHEKATLVRESLRSAGHIEWLQSLPRLIDREDFLLIHAGLHPSYGVETPVEIMTTIRSYDGKPWYDAYDGEKVIIYGHWAAQGLRIRENTIGLDSGCCFGGHLTVYCLESREIWQMRADRAYKVPGNWKEESREVRIGNPELRESR